MRAGLSFGLNGVAYEGIMPALVAEGGCRPMPGNKADIVPQRKKLAADRIQQLLVIAAREIGTADRAFKKHIPDHGQAGIGGIENHVPGRVSRCVNDLQLVLTELDRIAVLQPSVWLEDIRLAEAELAGLFG